MFCYRHTGKGLCDILTYRKHWTHLSLFCTMLAGCPGAARPLAWMTRPSSQVIGDEGHYACRILEINRSTSCDKVRD